MIVLPEAFVRVTVDREGAAGSAWLSTLPATVREVAERWDCTADGDLLYGGVGIVVPVLRKMTEPAVLKVSFPHPENRFEPDALSAWGGRGAVRLHERDDDRFAMLLERAHPTTLAQAAQGDEVAAIAGGVSRRLAVPAPAGLPRLQDRAAGWKEQLLRDAREFPDALPSRTVQAATATVRELAHHQPDGHGVRHRRRRRRGQPPLEDGIIRPWIVVADHRMLSGEAAAGRRVVERAKELAGGSHLSVRPVLEPRRHQARQIAEGIAARLVNAEVSRGADKPRLLQVAEQLGDKSRGGRGGSTNSVADTNDALGDASSCQRHLRVIARHSASPLRSSRPGLCRRTALPMYSRSPACLRTGLGGSRTAGSTHS
ncbi:aminoglycoside phosphotransferase family protein [Streptomyces sp. NBC_01142]|uniref:aminoglycoside phosphotransferase family protein n=1 Tax=Streptomyces sp. NBC_01142 TaxID=2975865 RepID=UPI00225B6A49|nr:aminoglycoside phosphotransferase family protein [Streptomyces sp. NBC_01142]MCX4826503.1 aminoglycoside phosphotransferase family protein [Streptomyces sp. NBC_01142]